MHTNSPDADELWAVLRQHVPEIASGIIQVVGMVRERGSRTVLAVATNDPRIDPVSFVSGLRGERIRRICEELHGELVDVIRWDDSKERFIANLLAPLRLARAAYDEGRREARVSVAGDAELRTSQMMLRSKLLSDLTGWKLHIDIAHEP